MLNFPESCNSDPWVPTLFLRASRESALLIDKNVGRFISDDVE